MTTDRDDIDHLTILVLIDGNDDRDWMIFLPCYSYP